MSGFEEFLGEVLDQGVLASCRAEGKLVLMHVGTPKVHHKFDDHLQLTFERVVAIAERAHRLRIEVFGEPAVPTLLRANTA